jgi:DNA invertase Pin-like site-specific DNA recombinase
MQPWVGYVRVSHVGARAGDRFHSPEDQAREIEAWARRRGDTVDVLEPELNVSGGKLERPILERAVEGIERGRYRGLVVAYLSRASRSLKHTLEIYERVERAGGQVVAIGENIDTTTANGRLNRNMHASIAEHQREQHVERFAELRESATRRGVWQRRQLPTGYAKDQRTRKLIPGPRADEVRAAFRARARGESVVSIAERLGMTPSGVRQLVRNRVYLGELRVGDHVNPEAHPALVDLELWEAAQRTVARPARTFDEPALLAGLIRCTGCGHVMSRQRTAGVVYTCHRLHSGGRCEHPAGITVALADRFVEDIALRELERVTATAMRGDGARHARERVTVAEAELGAYLEAVSAADVGAQAFGEGARKRRAAVEAARAELQDALSLVPLAPAGGSVRDVWPHLSVSERNQVLRGLVEFVAVAPAGRGRRVPVADRVRVVRHGAAVARVGLPDFDDPCVLRPLAGEDALESGGG